MRLHTDMDEDTQRHGGYITTRTGYTPTRTKIHSYTEVDTHWHGGGHTPTQSGIQTDTDEDTQRHEGGYTPTWRRVHTNTEDTQQHGGYIATWRRVHTNTVEAIGLFCVSCNVQFMRSHEPSHYLLERIYYVYIVFRQTLVGHWTHESWTFGMVSYLGTIYRELVIHLTVFNLLLQTWHQLSTVDKSCSPRLR